MNGIVQRKMKLFILAIIILIVLCITFIKHFNNKLYVNIHYDDSIKDVIISDVPDINLEDLIVDSTIKKTSININNPNIKLKINNEYNDKRILTTKDIIDIEIYNLNTKYEIYYSLRNEEISTDYKLFNNQLLNNIDTTNKFNLYIKIVTENNSKEFDLGEFKIYDIIYEYNANKVEDVELGTIYNDDGTIYKNDDNTEYLYDDMNINQNIVIDNVETEETIVVEEPKIEESNIELNGNIHIIEETDITNIDITGHLFIDTEENITVDKDILVDSNIYSITIKNSNFTINEQEYSYEYNEDLIKIKNSNNEEVNITDIFIETKTEINENNELIIIKDESTSSFSLN